MGIFKRIGKAFGSDDKDAEKTPERPSADAPPESPFGGAPPSCGSSPVGMSPLSATPPTSPPPEAKDDGVEVEVREPEAGAKTCQISVNRKVSPVGTVLFENLQDAEGWPLIQALFGIEGVHSIIAKESVLILSKEEEGDWSRILPAASEAIVTHLERAPKTGEEPKETVWIRNEQEVRTPMTPPSFTPGGDGRPKEASEEDLRARVQQILDREINPGVAMHGGVISLLDVQGTRLFIHMGGGCQGCGMASATLKQGVEATIRAQIPEVTEILDTTDHAAGNNPYYAPSAK